MIRRAFVSLFLLELAAASCVGAQQDAPLTADQRQAVIDSIAGDLNRMYVFPDVAARMDADLRARAAKGEFDKVGDRASFAQLLTQDLQAISHDKHLRVRMRASDAGSGPAGSFGAR